MTNDLKIDWIPTALWPGQLGLTAAPGANGRDMRADMTTLAMNGTHVVASLLHPEEHVRLGMYDYAARAADINIEVAACPLDGADLHRDPEGFAAFIEQLMEALLDGRTVVLHCQGGVGRAGLVAACLLVQAGMPAGDAVQLVRNTRSQEAVTKPGQLEFLHAFEQAAGGAPA